MKPLKTFLLLGIASVLNTADLSAQSFKALHYFSAFQGGSTNSDGAQPYNTGVVLAGDRLYGTTYTGGTNRSGVIFSLDTNGNNFTVLHAFTASGPPTYTNLDGNFPVGGLAVSGNTLYGTALNGGTNFGGYGTLYSLNTNGSNFTTLHTFDSVPNGSGPHGPPVLAEGRLYGVTEYGGQFDHGTVFSINTDGTDFTQLHAQTTADGTLPYAGLLLSGDTLYGTGTYGGTFGNGTIFSVKTNGVGFTLLHTFSPAPAPDRTNFDGTYPEAALVISGHKLYGTAVFGGEYNRGTLFSLNTNGSDFTALHHFMAAADGYFPIGLTATNGMLYGVASSGGVNGRGTVYSIKTDGTDFTILHTFPDSGVIGENPEGPLVMSGNTLYGTTEFGGSGYNGSVFSLTITPTISNISLAGTNLVINARNGVAGQTCYVVMSTDVTSPLATWTPMATNLLTGGSFTIIATNAVSLGAPQQFYALKAQ